jgi:hypothetical protein
MLAQHERPTTPPHAVSQLASTSPEDQPWRPNIVKARLTSNRPRRQVENDEYAAFARRILGACARRVGDGDVETLALMLDLAEEIDTAIAEAVKGLRAYGQSWAEIGSRLGITRQAALDSPGRKQQPEQQRRRTNPDGHPPAQRRIPC